MINTEIIHTEAKYGRTGWMEISDYTVAFDNSDGEYGLIEFDLELLEQKIKEHKEKLNNG